MFDFAQAAQDFGAHLNEGEKAKNTNKVFEIDAAELQSKWTDIEVRQHVLPKMEEEQKLLTNDFEEFPPELEEPDQEERHKAA